MYLILYEKECMIVAFRSFIKLSRTDAMKQLVFHGLLIQPIGLLSYVFGAWAFFSLFVVSCNFLALLVLYWCTFYWINCVGNRLLFSQQRSQSSYLKKLTRRQHDLSEATKAQSVDLRVYFKVIAFVNLFFVWLVFEFELQVLFSFVHNFWNSVVFISLKNNSLSLYWEHIQHRYPKLLSISIFVGLTIKRNLVVRTNLTLKTITNS
jgi:hypothetical protein